MKKIEKCGSELTQWSRKTFGNVRRELKEKRKLLSKVEKAAMQTGANFRLRELKKEINQLMVKENILWRQRAKSFWLVGGDQNSKYFHSRATLRHRRNRIKGVQNLAGEWFTHPSEIAYSFTNFYQTLFTSSNPNVEGPELDQLDRLVNDNMNAQLSQEFMEWEVQAALKQMAPLKSPSPDGMPPLFYQNYWDLVGGDVTNSILSFLNTATLPDSLNHTFLTLIPKTKKPHIRVRLPPNKSLQCPLQNLI